jgi:hypothetical protein
MELSENTQEEFAPFSKIARLDREIVVTEKIDGTNSRVVVKPDGTVLAGSKNRWIQPGKTTDNHGFAGWVKEHEDELQALGEGQHFGEWWGQGIQHGYGLKEKVFSLFNTHLWGDSSVRPACCSVVPVLYSGAFDMGAIQAVLESLKVNGSVAAPGFMKPEGVIIYHTHGGMYFKWTLGGDGHKGSKGE